jgi:Fic family protein
MDKSIFKNPNGKIITINNKYDVFVPNKLPVFINYNSSIIKKIELSNNYLGKLSGLINNLPNPDLFLKPYLKKEAVLSSKIEGTRSSLSDVFKVDINTKHLDNDLKEVLNYIKSLEFGLKEIESKDLTLDLILKLNEILLYDVRGFSKDSGKIRVVQNWIGNINSTLETSTYIPPNPEIVRDLLNNLIEYLNSSNSDSFLVKVAILHYQFEAIHPFVDGNGRVGRLLLILYLCKCKLLDKPVLYLSEYFEKNKEKYYYSLLQVSMNSNFNSWIEYFLDGVIEQSYKTIHRVSSLLDYRFKTRKFLKDKDVNIKVLKIYDYLFSNPYIDIKKGKEILNTKNYNTSKRVILKLVELGVLEETKNKLYIAKDINKILSDF